MNFVYIVVENGVPYPIAYNSFETAVEVVKEKHAEAIAEELLNADGEDICSDLDAPENTVTGITHLYVEKGINIYIYKLLVV